jgi:hypothetical protein
VVPVAMAALEVVLQPDQVETVVPVAL